MISRALKLSIFPLALALATVALSAATARHAQAEPLSCAEFDAGVNVFGDLIRAKFDERVAGIEYRISALKQLKVHRINSVKAGGGDCEITVVAQVTLQRKLRRDAHGTVTLRARVAADMVAPKLLDLGFTSIRVTNVSLSNTLDIGEAVYKWVANKVLPNSETIRVNL